jgi:prolyl-tRNA editing enzyme YbaK/EbsC (Cys-tRNA(Pro) deacylase)
VVDRHRSNRCSNWFSRPDPAGAVKTGRAVSRAVHLGEPDGASRSRRWQDLHMTSPAHPRVAAVARLLVDAGGTGEVRVLPDEVRTAASAAEALGVPVGAIVNSLVFTVDGSPLLVLTSGAHRVDETKVAGLLGVRHIAPASPDFVRLHTGSAIGGVAPIGHPAPIGTLVDVELARHDQVWAAAGHPAAVFSTSYEELLRLTAGTAAEIGNGPADPTAVTADGSPAGSRTDGIAEVVGQ